MNECADEGNGRLRVGLPAGTILLVGQFLPLAPRPFNLLVRLVVFSLLVYLAILKCYFAILAEYYCLIYKLVVL